MNQIKHGALLSYFNLGVNVIIGLVYTPWMIRTIGQTNYGLYTLAMSIIGMLAFDFGLGNATTKFICEYLATGRQDKVNTLLGLVYKLYLGIDILVLLVFGGIYMFLPEIYDGLTSDELSTFRMVYIIAATYCILSFPFIPIDGILKGYEKFVQQKSCDLFQRIFIVMTMAVCLTFGFGLYALVFVNSIAGIITICIKIYLIKRDTPLQIRFSFWDAAELKRIFHFVIWVTVISLAQRLIFNIAPSILGIFADSQQIAILGVAITIESYTYLFANAISGMFLPRVSKMVANADVGSVLNLMIRVGRLQLFVCGFIVLWFVFFGAHFIDYWVGDEYRLVYPCALLFLIPIVMQLPQEIGMTYIVAANKVRLQSYIFIAMAVINIILAVPLTIYFGVIGLSFAIFFAYSIRTIALDVLFAKKMHLDIKCFFRRCYGQLMPAFIVSALFFILFSYIPLGGWVGIIVKSLCALAAYALVIMKMGANAYERELIFSIVKHK